MTLTSKLPQVTTTIFTRMSTLANQYQALNLSQGFPDFDAPELLVDKVSQYMKLGLNQYAPMTGVAKLREQISQLCQQHYQCSADFDTMITVTSGATEALFVAIMTVIGIDDEVIVFDPAYDSYVPAIQMAGGRAVHIPLSQPNFTIDWQRVEETLNSKTKAIIINSPHNPTGSTLSEEDLLTLEALVVKHGLYVISDEVYEHIIFDNHQHQSILRFPALLERSFVISSFGKTFHTTGWKIGYCIANENLSAEFRKIHQYVTFCTTAPMQFAFADMLEQKPEHWQNLGQFYQLKRDFLAAQLSNSRFKLLPCQGTYFQLLNYSAISNQSDQDFCHYLVSQVGVAAIPISVFYENNTDQQIIRLCFAKNETTLAHACQRLSQL